MALHKEIKFENAICDHLAKHGWLYTDGDASRYDRARAMFPDDVIAWLQEHRTALISAAVTGKIDIRGQHEMESA